MSAGTTMPPIAAAIGSDARLTDASSPASTSRLISSPTTKKNTAIHRSLTHNSSGLDSTSQSFAMRTSPRISTKWR